MWKPLSAIDRRVAGVLVEKAKTTPDQYPLTVNAIVTGANQKSNRHPQMELSADDVRESLERLRELGAVSEIQGSGRVDKYRHLLYEWLGVEKVELSVMAELLLRGAQTEGELRGRAARMDPIADLTALRPILDSLAAKKLIVSLTPPGRGHVLTHALYQPQELEKLRREHHAESAPPTTAPPPPENRRGLSPFVESAEQKGTVPISPGGSPPRAAPNTAPPPAAASSVVTQAAESLHREMQSLRAELSQLRSELEELAERQRRTDDELQQTKSALGG